LFAVLRNATLVARLLAWAEAMVIFDKALVAILQSALVVSVKAVVAIPAVLVSSALAATIPGGAGQAVAGQAPARSAVP
jgi:hypothetical protein